VELAHLQAAMSLGCRLQWRPISLSPASLLHVCTQHRVRCARMYLAGTPAPNVGPTVHVESTKDQAKYSTGSECKSVAGRNGSVQAALHRVGMEEQVISVKKGEAAHRSPDLLEEVNSGVGIVEDTQAGGDAVSSASKTGEMPESEAVNAGRAPPFSAATTTGATIVLEKAEMKPLRTEFKHAGSDMGGDTDDDESGMGVSEVRAAVPAAEAHALGWLVLLLREERCQHAAVLDVRGKSSQCDFFVLATCVAARHMQHVAAELSQQGKKHGMRYSCEGKAESAWLVCQLDQIQVHLLMADMRARLELEKLWTLGEYDDQMRELANNDKHI